MNNLLKIAISAAAGAIVGSVVTYLVTNKVVKDKYAAISDEEIASVVETFRKEAREDEEIVEAAEEVLSEAEIIEQLEYKEKLEKLKYWSEHGPIKDETRPEVEITIQAIDTSPEEGFPTYEEERKHLILQGRPYIITQLEYEHDEDLYDKIYLEYYDLDDTMTDEEGGLVDDIDDKVNSINLDRFGWNADNERSVYVRNDAQGVDFHIVKMEASHSVSVLGISEEYLDPPKEKPKKKLRDED